LINRAAHITTLIFRKISDFMRFGIILFAVFMLLPPALIHAQVISNYGAYINVTSGVAVVSKDFGNNVGSTLFNGGIINLSGNFLNAGTTSNNGFLNMIGNFTNSSLTDGNGTIRLGGNWLNTGFLSLGTSTVVFNGSSDQFITRPGAEIFYNLSIENSGAPSGFSVKLSNIVSVNGTLFMKAGNVTATGFKLQLVNQAVTSLDYSSETNSRIFGQFERGIGEVGNFLFPLGNITRPSYYNPARIIINNLNNNGTLLTEFLTAPPLNNNGLPIPDVTADPAVEVDSVYTSGYWNITAQSSFSSQNYNVVLYADGFSEPVRYVTRIVKRDAGGPWELDGVHSNADTINNIVKRNSLNNSVSESGTQFALARANPLITGHPIKQDVCETNTAIFIVTASGAEPLTYRWYKEGFGALTDSERYNGTNRTSTLVINQVVLGDAGNYYCVVRDRFGNTTISNSAPLQVFKIPIAIVNPITQGHACSEVPFDNIILDLSNYDTPTRFVWERTTDPNIETTVPLTGTEYDVPDFIPGSFKNLSDAPITITFKITPIGPEPTLCTGVPKFATITVNPRPRVIPVWKEICYGESTSITLVSPSTMTQPGVIRFNYDISVSSGTVSGNMIPANNVAYGSVISYPYTNNDDTAQSVYYNVTPIVPALGCPDGIKLPFETSIHAKPLQSLLITEPLTCEGGSDADLLAVTSRGAGGANGYYFDWVRTQLDQVHGYNIPVLENRRGGRWDLTVTDNLNCKSSAFIFVAGAILDSYLYVPVDPATGFATSCPGSADGQIWIKENNSSTGIAPFEYWITRVGLDTASTDMHGHLADKEIINIWPGLPAGKYQLYLKDANGCFNINYPETDIVEPDVITVTFESKKYDGDFDISCRGYNDGSVWVKTLTGGNGGYRYKWTTVNGLITGVDTLNRLDNITAGTYYLHTTDIKGCMKTDSVTINEPSGMVLSDFGLSVKPDGTYNVSCNGSSDGFINITVTGGSGTYTYLWSGPDGFTDTREDITQLKAGVYSCIVRDLNGCLLAPAPSFTLTEPPDLTIVSSASLSADGDYNINCFGGTGSVQVTVTGGIPGTYQYLWSTSDGSGLVSGQEDQNALGAGTYDLTVTDINGCTETMSITLSQPDRIDLQLDEKNITCASGVFNDGAIDLTVSGGVGPFTYLWSNGASTEDISDLTEGTYSVTVTDSNGCTATASGGVVNPPPLTYSKTISDYNGYNISCFGMSNGSVTVNTTSGTPPFIFSWTGPDGFSATTPDISGLRAGTYILNITDSLFCHITETIVLIEPGQLGMAISLPSSNAGGFNINCAGERTGYIGIEPLNQVMDVEYLWSDGLFGKTRTDLPAGEYSVIITDANNCYASATVSLTEPDSIRIEFAVTQPFCPDMPNGAVVATVTGGVPAADYTYRWSDNSTGSVLTDIPAGYYSLTVRDMNGCTVRDSVNVEPENRTCLIIPNAISPNGDLINDEWNIGNTDLYPQIEVRIFNRWGLSVWRSEKGYPQPWDGRRAGRSLPIDSYHYIIDLNNGTKPIIGTITIVR
jgi:gliding motility-associated-like protein